MRNIILKLTLLSSCLFCWACDDEDKVSDIDKDGAIETVIKVEHLDSKNDVIETQYNVWVNKVMVKTLIHRDTLPSLGKTTQEAEDESGSTKNVTLNKDYEIYITVK